MRLLSIILPLLFIVNTSFAKAIKTKTDWTLEALRLTGESARVRDKAIHKLLKIPHLKKKLHLELKGPHRNLALDVISSLGFEDFLPELLSIAKSESSGIYYLSVNSLITNKNQKIIAGIYRERLVCGKTCGVSPAAEVLLLDTLAQISTPLAFEELKKIFDGGWYEVKSAVLNYVRVFLLKTPETIAYLPLLTWSLDSPIIQLRWQTIYLLRELPTSLRAGFIKSIKKCKLVDDPRTPPDVLKLCALLTGGSV